MANHTHFIDAQEFENYHNEIILASHSQLRKRLILVIQAKITANKNITLETSYHVTNQFDQVIHIGGHLKPAIKEYNKL